MHRAWDVHHELKADFGEAWPKHLFAHRSEKALSGDFSSELCMTF